MTEHTPGPVQADARLIAAAPELLEACEAALGRIERGFETSKKKTAEGNLLRDAIAKAKGQKYFSVDKNGNGAWAIFRADGRCVPFIKRETCEAVLRRFETGEDDPNGYLWIDNPPAIG